MLIYGQLVPVVMVLGRAINNISAGFCKVLKVSHVFTPRNSVSRENLHQLELRIFFHSLLDITGFPLGLENLENLEKWEGIFQSGKSQGILNRLEKSGKSQGKSHKILEN